MADRDAGETGRRFRDYLALSDVVQIAILIVLTVTAIFVYHQARVLQSNYSFDIVRALRADTAELHQELFAPGSYYQRLAAIPCEETPPRSVEMRFLARSISDHYRLYQLAASQAMITQAEWREVCAVGRSLIRENCQLESFWHSDGAPRDDPAFVAEFDTC